MRVLLIQGDVPVPPALRDLIERGSTSLVERRAAEIKADAGNLTDQFDRVVFWSAGEAAAVRKIADQFAKAEAKQRREMVVFVAPDEGGAEPARLSPHERFVWPRDEDRLKMAFLTGA
jgi:hypothetical protein